MIYSLYFLFLFLIIHIIPFSCDALSFFVIFLIISSFMKIKMNVITSCDWVIRLYGLTSCRFNRCYTRIFLWEFNNHFTWSRLVSRRNTVKERFRRCLSFCFWVSYSMDPWNSRYLCLLECDCFPRYLSSRFQLGFLVLAYSSEYIIFIAFIGLNQSWSPVKSFSVIMLQEVIIVQEKETRPRDILFSLCIFSLLSLLISVPSHWLFVTRIR